MELTKIFTLQPQPMILFGINAIDKFGEKVKDFKANRALIVTDKGVVGAGGLEGIKKVLEASGVDLVVYDEVIPNSSVEIVDKGAKLTKEKECEVVIGVGGGSSLDTAKAIGAMVTNAGSIKDYEGINKIKNSPLPIIAIPTTAGTGSEVTMFSVITDEKRKLKMVIGSPLLIPALAIDDPTLTISMPPSITATTGMDALTHAIESYVNTVTQPISEALALEAIKLISKNLRIAVANGGNIEARYNMLLASLMAGIAFNSTRLGISHALAMPLGGGECNLPHGLTNAITLPYVMEFNLIANLPKFAEIAKAMGEKVEGMPIREAAVKAVEAVKRLSQDIGIPRSLREVGVKEEVIPQVAAEAMKSGNILVNPRKPTAEDVIEICKKALSP